MAEVNEEQAPIWKDLSPKQSHNNCVFFKPPPSTKTMEVIDAVTSSGYDDVLSVQISVKKCILTFLSRENAEAIVEHGMDLGGVSYSLCLVSESRIELKIVDAPIWVPDEDILAEISIFGTRHGSVRHAFVRIPPGTRIATGVRYMRFRLHQNRHIPSYLRTKAGVGKSPVAFRVMYEGQVRTCRHCNLTGHLAADCPHPSRRHAESENPPQNQQVTIPSPVTPVTNTSNVTNDSTRHHEPSTPRQTTFAAVVTTTHSLLGLP